MARDGVVLRMPKNTADEQDVLDEWRRKPLMEKFRDHYHGKTADVPDIKRFVNSVAAFWFLYCVFTELYVFLFYIIPWYFGLYTPTFQLGLQLFSVFVCLQLLVNWYYLRYTNTSTGTKLYVHGNQEYGTISQAGVVTKISKENATNGQQTNSSWCNICCGNIPPRAHHCKFCKKCILKRDHHCYMTGVCVGFWNQRFFIVINTYILIASLAGLICIFSYVRHHTPENFTWTNFFLPFTFVKWLWGSVETHMMFMICHLYTLWWSGAMAIGYTALQARCLQLGLTNHEYRNIYPKIRCYSSIMDNIRSVFGSYWLVNFLFPAHKLFPQEGDGSQWNNVFRQ